MNGCIVRHVLCINRLVTFSSLSSVIIGFVWVWGGRFFISLISFFCIRIRGWMYVWFGSDVPQIVLDPMRCG